MGLGCVLIVWLAFLPIAALPVGAGLFYWSRRNARAFPASPRWRPFIAGFLSFVLIPVGVVWFIGYAVYCDVVRAVDPGLGDGWMVPLGNGYQFCMVDVPDKGFIMKDTCSGTAAVDDVVQLVQIGDVIVGSAENAPGFAFDTRTNAMKAFPDARAALAQFEGRPT